MSYAFEILDAKIKQIAAHYNIPFGNRSVYESFVYNGENIGIWKPLFGSSSRDSAMMVVADVLIDNFTLLHEMAHHVISEEYQRSLPEWGLCFGIVMNFETIPEEYRSQDWVQSMQSLLEKDEELLQEISAQYLTYLWAKKYDIPEEWLYDEFKNTYPCGLSWDEYSSFKEKESSPSLWEEAKIRAQSKL